MVEAQPKRVVSIKLTALVIIVDWPLLRSPSLRNQLTRPAGVPAMRWTHGEGVCRIPLIERLVILTMGLTCMNLEWARSGALSTVSNFGARAIGTANGDKSPSRHLVDIARQFL